jgi:hypothetical protein
MNGLGVGSEKVRVDAASGADDSVDFMTCSS